MKKAEEFITEHYGQPQGDMEAEQLKEFAELMEEYAEAKAGQHETIVNWLPSVKPIFAWYDLWIGFYWDSEKSRLYFLPLPCIGLIFEWKKDS